MARKRRAGNGPAPSPTAPAGTAGAAPAVDDTPALPGEAPASRTTAAILAGTMLLAPALGVPNELLLQDTFKSALVAFAALGAALLLFLANRRHTAALRWHAVLWLPLALAAYALGSMAWSHAYLGGVEAIRWFLFALLAWLGLNSLGRDRMPMLAWGIHLGALGAALWAALQFWADFALFPQGPNPASTFVNRNFFAEFVVCTLPFSAWLLAQARQSSAVALLAASNAFVITTILMTGTRSALVALWLQLLVLLPLAAWRCRSQLALRDWSRGLCMLAAGVLAATVLVLGLIPTGNPKIAAEERGTTALERAVRRTQSVRPDDPSLNLRLVMWRATGRMIADRPLAGVGAGAWENAVPLYQDRGAQLETDYYVHNEYLQLVAEYGLLGWAVLLALLGWLASCAWRTWQAGTGDMEAERAPRAVVLCSLAAFFIVSAIGFPWRMAATGALFALLLGALAASEARLGRRGAWQARAMPWSPRIAAGASVATVACIALAVHITQRAAEAERDLVGAAKIALTITASGDWDNPRWATRKQAMLEMVRAGVAINPHYRKVTPIVADELARWNDWRNALWIWDSVLQSRPYVVAIIGNAARAEIALGDYGKAAELLERARRLQPDAPTVKSLEVVLAGRTGDEPRALALARQALAAGVYDFDLLTAAIILGRRAHDHALVRQALELRLRDQPAARAGTYTQLGELYAVDMKDPERALEAYRQALAAAATPQERDKVLARVPADLKPRLR